MADELMPGFGRLHVPDPRDQLFLFTQPTMPEGKRFWYDRGWFGFQGNKPQCVGYSFLHVLEDAPVSRPGPAPFHDPSDIYHRAQLVDDVPGEDYDGTTIRAGAKVCQELGYIKQYDWADSVEALATAILHRGPAIVGTTWYDSMVTPVSRKDAQGRYRKTLTIKEGALSMGGHAWVVNGVNTFAGGFRMKNSWGRDWGVGGRAWVPFSVMSRLLAENGEACLIVE